jgi:hypothetical protein
MAAVCHVTSSSGLRKFQADGFLSDRVYRRADECPEVAEELRPSPVTHLLVHQELVDKLLIGK